MSCSTPNSISTRLSSWNLPYVAYTKALGFGTDQPSPFATDGATPSYLNVHSPEATTPGRRPAAPDPSPTMQMVRQKVALDRASLFLQGRTKELLASCGREDRMYANPLIPSTLDIIPVHLSSSLLSSPLRLFQLSSPNQLPKYPGTDF